MRDAPGRNALCPCGSGRKYKRCCLPRRQGRLEETRRISGEALPLLRALFEYTVRGRGMALQSVAARYFSFWPRPLTPEQEERLIEFATFDAGLYEGSASAAIEFARERGPFLTPLQREYVALWCDTGTRLWTLAAREGQVLTCRSLLPVNGETRDVICLRKVPPVDTGAPLALRALQTGASAVCAAPPVVFDGRHAEDVAAAIVRRHHDFVRTQRILGLEEFMRRCGWIFDEEAYAARHRHIIVP
jgi:hypothetical protein